MKGGEERKVSRQGSNRHKQQKKQKKRKQKTKKTKKAKKTKKTKKSLNPFLSYTSYKKSRFHKFGFKLKLCHQTNLQCTLVFMKKKKKKIITVIYWLSYLQVYQPPSNF